MEERDPGDERSTADIEAGAVLSRRWQRRLWLLLFVIVTVGLWVQLLGMGTAAELQSEDGTGIAVTLYLIPLIAAMIAVVWRHPAGRLALYPVSFLPGLAWLPDAEWQSLASAGSLVPAAATLAVYFVVAASRPSEMPARIEQGRRDSRGDSSDDHALRYRRFVVSRFSVMALIFVVITYALFVDAGIQESLATLQDQTASKTQQLFSAAAVYLGWLVVVYVGAVVPALNWEYHRRRSPLSSGVRRLIEEPNRLVRRIVLWLCGLMAITAVVLWYVL